VKYIDKLRNSGLRPTKQRLQICEVLFDTEKTFHFTINELDQKIKKQKNNTYNCLRIEYYLIDLILLDNRDSLREAVFLCINPFETPL